MSTHTPGPWTCNPTLTPEYDDDLMGCYTVEPAASLLQERFDKADFDSEILDPIHNENRANALLIAAAPELKNLLFHALHYIETPGDFTETERLELCQDIDDLIAKAEGRA